MRAQSLSLRLLLLAVLLTTIAFLCVVVLVMAGVIHPAGGQLAGMSGAILLVAMLAATISALGPKYRPTPFLTPMVAGAFAAILATTAVYAAHSHIAPKAKPAAAQTATLKVKKPKAASSRPVTTEPVVAPAPVEPEVAVADPKAVRVLDAGFDAAASPEIPLPAPAVASGPIPQDTAPPAEVAPEPKVATAVVEPEPAPSTVPAEAGKAVAPPVAATTPRKPVPTPRPAPGDASGAPLNLQATFDVRTPAQQNVGAPMSLAAGANPAPAAPAIPPTPRIRPCGGAGPACP